MKKAVLTTMILCIGLSMTQAQNKQGTPEEKSIVNKEFDENGNLLKYDSTYVWQWNSDSTMSFSFGDDWAFGQKFPDMFGEFFNDSIFEKYGLFNNPSFQPFGNDDFFGQFGHTFPGFPFENDSVFRYHFGQPFQDDFGLKEFEELQKQMQRYFNQRNNMLPDFSTPEQRREWEELLQKQQKEKEELLKKWRKL